MHVSPPNFPANNSIKCFAVIGTNLFAGSNGKGIFLSTNNGTSWSAVDSGLTNTDVRALAVSGTNLFAGTWGSGVFLSTNNGTSWSVVDTGLTNPYINSLLGNGTDIIVGTNTVAFISGNNGTNWGEINSGMTGSQIISLAANGSNLFAGNDRGVWRRPLSEMITGVKEEHNNLPTNFSLEQNYPNPFNPTTVINFSIPKNYMVSIRVYDILGNEVANLMNEEKTAGSYSINFNASKLSSGVYFYRMQAGSFVKTKKLILMK